MQMSYPDGEVLTYHYDSGGLVNAAAGVKSGVRTDYLKRLEYDKFEQRTFLELGNGLKTAYAYDPFSRRLCALNTAKDAQATACRDFESAPDTAPGLQALVYQYDAVGNIMGLRNTVAVQPASEFGGPVKQRFAYDDLYRLTQAEGSYRVSPNTVRDYQLELAYDSIHNIRSKQQADRVTHPGGVPITQKKTSYAWNYDYAQSGPASVRPHAPIHIGERTYSYDANGNQTGWDNDNNGTDRTIAWDEENRIQSVKDNGHEKSYWYDDAGERVIKRGPQGETVYVNQWYTIRDRSIATKHVFVGASRIASRLVPGSASGGTPSSVTTVTAPTFPGQGLAHRSETANLHAQNTVQNPHFAGTTTTTTTTGSTLPTRDNFLYYYHPDHLGSTSHVTDDNGKLYEHIEYFPFGESWVEESSNTQRTPYLFTGKELDEETGLYYFGARYYDPRTGVWQSVDAILDEYLDGKRNSGAFNSRNLGLYSYGHNNPMLLVDPDGNSPETLKYLKGFLLGPDKPATTTPENRMPTPRQYELAKGGKLDQMWAERASPKVQDPIANVGLGVWGSFDDNVDAHGVIGAVYWKTIGAMTKLNSEMALGEALGRTPSEQETRRFGIKIATSHLDATKQDREGVPFNLSPRQVTAYHQPVFKQFGAKRGWYGGSYLPFTDNETHWTLLQPIYCWSCDANKTDK